LAGEWLMQPFTVYIAYVSWGDDGKRRPVLVLSEKDNNVSVFQITTQYQNKSAAVQLKYLIINNWQEAGFDKPSYIDTSKIIELSITSFDISPIRKLTEEDKRRLLGFIK
jgi:hypothetical protein